jgi:hypothetical protein
MLREAHRSQFDPALEVAGSGLGQRLSNPPRVDSVEKGGGCEAEISVIQSV